MESEAGLLDFTVGITQWLFSLVRGSADSTFYLRFVSGPAQQVSSTDYNFRSCSLSWEEFWNGDLEGKRKHAPQEPDADICTY